jgi:hypothetical protein
VCKLTNEAKLFVENVYNDGKSPISVDGIFSNIGISNKAFSLQQGIFTCSFKRKIKSDQYTDKYFDLENSFFAFLAKGPLSPTGKTLNYLLFSFYRV